MKELEAAAFDIAYFWKLDPGAVLALPLSRFELYAHHTGRIAEQVK